VLVILVALDLLNALDNIHSLLDPPKYSVLVVEPRRLQGSCTWAGVGSDATRTGIGLDHKAAVGLRTGAVVMKNWDPLVPGPALAMDSVNGLSWRSERWNSSSNS
jgi:hypothetical protein